MTDNTPKSSNTEKYRELYMFSKEAFKDEDDRYNRIEDKAFKFNTALVFLFGVWGFFAKWMFEELWPRSGAIDRMGVALIALAFLSLVTGCFQLLRAVRSRKVRSPRPKQKDVDFFEAHDLPDLYKAYAKEFNSARDYNADITDKKAGMLICVYEAIWASVLFIILSGLVYVAHPAH